MKYLKKIILLIIIIITIGSIFFAIDYTRVKKEKLPIFCLNFDSMTYMDGGSKVYWGLGYKVIAYNKLNGYNKIHIGTYFLEYDDKL